MKRVFISLFFFAMTFIVSCSKNEIFENILAPVGEDAAASSSSADSIALEKSMFIPGTAIVKFSEEMTEAIEKGVVTKAMSSLPEELGLRIVERVFPDAGEYEERTRREGLHRFYVVEYDEEFPYEKVRGIVSSIEGVDNIEPCRKVKSLAVNDPYLSRLWGFSGTYSIHAQEAWQYTVGNPSVVVCVVDDGVQQDHEDLKWNLYSDNYNFVRRNTNIHPEEHGTHVAGTIAGITNNGIGIAGIAGGDYKANRRGVSIQSAQVFEGDNGVNNIGTAIKWGADHGALISQNSWGYDYDWDGDGKITGEELEAALAGEVSELDAAAIDYFTKYAGCDNAGNQRPGSPMKGGIVVFAAGNDGLENGVPAKYPAALAVGAVNSAGGVAFFSNWGDWVDICAPGQNILSTIPGNRKYEYMSGTSMACPHVSGACALLLSFFGGNGFTNEMLREILINGANPSRIVYNSHPIGPYLDLMGSINYGLEKYKRESNNDPEISTDYKGNFVFRQYQKISIPFHITDPDGDNVIVEAEFDGKGELIQDSKNLEIWNFTLIGEQVSDFTPKNAVIRVRDIYGGVAEYKFTYQVLKNNAPKAVGTIDNMIIIGTGQRRQVNLAGLFTDADGEQLTISAEDIDGAPAELNVEGETLTLLTTSYGSSTITVSAVDGLKEKASITFKYVVRPEEVDMDFYPNPVKDYLYVRTGASAEEARIVIETSTGNVLYNEIKVCSAFEPVKVNMESFAPGMYVLRVSVGGKTYVNNIVKR